MLNKVILLGRFVRDPELRYTTTQTPVASFTLAVDDDIKTGDERKTQFIECVSWKGTAEFVSKYFHKGSLAAVEGRLQLRDWTDKEGNKRRTAEVVVANIYFGESRRQDPVETGAQDFQELPDDEEELPF